MEKDWSNLSEELHEIPIIWNEEPPFNWFAYFVFLIFGIGTLLSWNACLTALDYFYVKLHTNSYDPYFTFGILMNLPNFLFTLVPLFFHGHLSPKTRIVYSLITTFILGISMPIITEFVAGT